LEAATLIERTDDAGYTLTPMGHKLRTAIRPLTTWANTWADALADQAPAETLPASQTKRPRKERAAPAAK
ncbi:MAG: hypothetical protein J2P57_14105, partial [Acidimicrobiaceae bacterium]|nr:hypothetical protein [Acidimicrobiaceae bacterium]